MAIIINPYLIRNPRVQRLSLLMASITSNVVILSSSLGFSLAIFSTRLIIIMRQRNMITGIRKIIIAYRSVILNLLHCL